jgi:small subunit ribosomal protein S20
MAHTKQALKRARQNERIKQRNKAMRSDMKTQIKAIRAAMAAKDDKKVAELLRSTQGKLDKAAKHRVVHPNAAARIKSRLTRRTSAARAKK